MGCPEALVHLRMHIPWLSYSIMATSKHHVLSIAGHHPSLREEHLQQRFSASDMGGDWSKSAVHSNNQDHKNKP